MQKTFMRVKVSELVPYENNPRTIPEEAVDDVRESIWLAFAGIYDGRTILEIAVSTSIIEAIVALCDTPFLYLVRKHDDVRHKPMEETA